MTLTLVKYLNYDAAYTYAPPQEDALVNPDEIVSVYGIEARGPGPFVLVTFKDGHSITCVGTPTMFLGNPLPGASDRMSRLEAAVLASYEHLDRFGTASGGSDEEMLSQNRAFTLLSPLVENLRKKGGL